MILLSTLINGIREHFSGCIGLAIGKDHDSTRVIQEAVCKALGSSTSLAPSCHVVRKPRRPPRVHLHSSLNDMALEKGITKWFVSLTHDQGLALAFAIGSSDAQPIYGVGVDLTHENRFRPFTNNAETLEAFKEKTLHPSECSLPDQSAPLCGHLARLWTLKEAAYKALPFQQPAFGAFQKETLVSLVDSRYVVTTNYSKKIHVSLAEERGFFAATAILPCL